MPHDGNRRVSMTWSLTDTDLGVEQSEGATLLNHGKIMDSCCQSVLQKSFAFSLSTLQQDGFPAVGQTDRRRGH